MRCQHCSEELVEGKSFCSGCGQKVEIEVPSTKPRHCGDCGAVLEVGKDFCGDCGASVVSNHTPVNTKDKSEVTTSQVGRVGQKFNFKGFCKRKNPAGKGAVDTTVEIREKGLFLRKSICRNRRLPRKITEKEIAFTDIQSVNVDFSINWGYMFLVVSCTILACCLYQFYFILFAIIGIGDGKGETITLNLKYENPYYISSKGKKSEEFVQLVVNELRKNG